MKYYIGIDGGGTKTQYAIADECGHILCTHEGKGSSYKQSSAEEISIMLKNTIEKITKDIDSSNVEVAWAGSFALLTIAYQ